MPDNSTGQIGSGVRIFFASASPHVWTEIPGILGEPTLPEIERDEVETTIHGTTSLRTKIPGLGTVNDLECELRANLEAGSVHRQLKQFERTQEDVYFRVQVPVSADLSNTLYVAVQILGRVKKAVTKSPIDALKTIELGVLFTGSYQSQEAMASVL